MPTLSKEGGRGRPGKQGLEATAWVLAFPLRARHVSTAGHEPNSHKKTPRSCYTEGEGCAQKGPTRRGDGGLSQGAVASGCEKGLTLGT